MEHGHCRSCGAAIIWAKMTAGNLMPVEEDVVGDWFFCGDILTKVDLFTNAAQGKARYTSHFARCPDASSWRHKKRGKQ